MDGPNSHRTRVRFGAFELDCAPGGALVRSGVRVKLQDQPARLLAFLAQRAGELVTRDELRQRLWPEGTFVDFDHGLNTAIRKLRTALEESAEAPWCIETVSRHGYRFIAPVEWIEEPKAPVAPQRTAWWRLAAVLAAVAVATAAFVPIAHEIGGAPESLDAIAVLPLANPDPRTAYVSEGVTEALINGISAISDLRVMARSTVFAMKDAGLDPRRAGRQLGVPVVVAGAFMPLGDRVRITVELIDTRDGTRLWGRNYEGSKKALFVLQRSIVLDLAQRLRPNLDAAEIARLRTPRSTGPEAYDLYLRGLSAWNQRNGRTLPSIVGYYERALAIDPQFSPAWAGLAAAYGAMVGYDLVRPREGQPRVFAAVDRALSLDPDLPDAFTVRAAARQQYDRDFAGAEADYQRAIALNPNDATAHLWYASLLETTGRTLEARKQTEIAHRLDPLSAPVTRAGCWHLFLERRFEEAVEYDRRARLLEPQFDQFPCIHDSLMALGRYDEVIEELNLPRRRFLSPHASELALALRNGGPPAYFRKRLEILTLRGEPRYVSPVSIARLHAQAGDADQAFAWLQRALGERASGAAAFYTDPAWDLLRADPRFEEMARAAGLPQVSARRRDGRDSGS